MSLSPNDANAIASKKYRDKRKNDPVYKAKRAASNKRWRLNNLEYLKVQQKLYRMSLSKSKRIRRRAVNRKSAIKCAFGLSMEKYDSMRKEQNYCCAICNKSEKTLKQNLRLDHNHQTGKIRKFLCNNCNLLLGHSFDNIDVLQKAAEYLTIHL